jgi:enterochelin esterase family protein
MRRPGDYPVSAEALPQEGIPKGRLEGPFEFHSKIIANTVRRYWIFVPAQYNEKKPQPANVLVFQDGQRATNPDGPLRLPQVMENLIGKGKMPTPSSSRQQARPTRRISSQSNHRREEYDALGDTYARFLIRRCFLWAGNTLPTTRKRAIGGTSSGAIAASPWRAAAGHVPPVISPRQLRRSDVRRPRTQAVVPGGDLPTLIRRNRSPIRIYLQDGEGSSNEHGNWYLANCRCCRRSNCECEADRARWGALR